MATVCATPFKVPRLRATRLDECGNVVEGDCSTVVTDGTITVEIAREYEDREDFFKKNGDGVFCVKETDPPILKWINLTMTMCNVDPYLVNLVAGEEVLTDDASPTPNVIGFRTTEGSSALVNVAIEVWTRTTGACLPGQVVRYGWLGFPWVIEGTVGDLTLENGAADFILTARTQSGSPYGVGPYTIQRSAAVATLGDPLPFYQVVGDLDHEEWLWTTLAPPAASCGCIALPLPLVAVDSGVLTATATKPTAINFPVFVDWGDLTPLAEYTTAPVTHVYAIAGSYDISMYPSDVSSGAYTALNVAIA